MKYTVTLSDSTTFENLTKNGDYFVFDGKITSGNFKNNLDAVTITDSDGNVEEHTNMELINICQLDGGYGFAIREISEEKIRRMATDAAIAELTEIIATLM